MSRGLTRMISFLKRLFGSTEHDREARDLALRAESGVRKLSGLPPRNDTPLSDLKTILASVCLLLDRVSEKQATTVEYDPSSPPPLTIREHQILTPRVTPEDSAPPIDAQSSPIVSSTLSATAKELIKLRDWVLLAKSEDPTATAGVLEGVYKKLAQILEKEGVMALEEEGMFDEERHQIIDTRTTHDPSQNDFICDTVRPGYLFNGEVIRPQQIIVFTFEPASPD